MLWSGYIATWSTLTGANTAIAAAWWLAGVGLLQAIAHHVARSRATSTGPATSTELAHVVHGPHLGDAAEDWESEGGAIA